MRTFHRMIAPAVTAVLTMSPVVLAHPGHPEVPGMSHDQSHVVVAALVVVVGVVLAAGAVWMLRRGKRSESNGAKRV